MQLSASQLEQQLSQPPLAACYVLHGNEPLLISETGDRIRSLAHEQGFTERDILIVTPGFRWSQLAMAVTSHSLFGERKLIDLRIPSAKPGKDGADALQRHLEQLSGDSITLITLGTLDFAARKSAWFKALDQHAHICELNAPGHEALPHWIAARLAQQQQSADEATYHYIADHVEGNLLAAHQEILKLGLLYPEGSLSLSQVQEAIFDVARHNVDMLRQAILQGDAERTMRVMAGLQAESVALPLLLWHICHDLRQLNGLISAITEGTTLPQALKKMRIFDETRKRLYTRAAAQLSTVLLRRALQHAAHIDRMIKGLENGDPWIDLQRLVLRLCRKIR